MRAAIYCRISADPDESAAGVTRQERDCRDYVERQGWNVAGVYVDNDTSASQPMEKRSEFMAMLADAEEGEFDAIVAWRDDRLWRSPDHQRTVFALARDMGIETVATPSGQYDPSSHDDQFVAGIRGLVAEYEAATVAIRVQRALRQRAEDGKPNPGRRPFGWDSWRREEERLDEAAEIRDAVDRMIAGESIRSVTADWNDRGVTPPYADEWSGTSLRRMVRSPAIAGLREHRGEIIGEGQWRAIIPRERWERLHAVLDRRGHDQSPSARRLLSGWATCGRCGAGLVSGMSSGGDRRYVCRDCQRISIAADTLDDLVAGAVIFRLAHSDLPAVESSGDEEEELAALEARREQLNHDYYVEGVIDRAEFVAARDALSDRLDTVRDRLARERGGDALAGVDRESLASTWAERSTEWQRSVIESVTRGVVINPGRRGPSVDPGRITVQWVDAGV